MDRRFQPTGDFEEQEEIEHDGFSPASQFRDAGWTDVDDVEQYPVVIELFDGSQIEIQDEEMHKEIAENRRTLDERIAEED